MPRLRLGSFAQDDLAHLYPDEFSAAWELIESLCRNPGQGKLVSPLQFDLDPNLHPPCTFAETRIGPGRFLVVYFEVGAGTLFVQRVVSYTRM